MNLNPRSEHPRSAFPPTLFDLEEDERLHARSRRWGRAARALRTTALFAGGAALLAAGAYVAGQFLGRRPGSAPAAAPLAPSSAPSLPAAVETDAVQRALEAYQLRASLFAGRRMTCDDLGRGLADLDAQWLQYNLTLRRAGVQADSELGAPDEALARAVAQAENDFEETG